MMTGIKTGDKRKGGRPKQKVCRSQQLALMCTLLERKVIEHKAKAASMSLSEFLRSAALNRSIDRKLKTLPPEVLQYTATLNHLAANLNQIARKRNRSDELNALERAELNHLSGCLKQLATDIKNYLK